MWKVEPEQRTHGESLCIVDENGRILAKTPMPLVKEDEGNLRLMAAAPALFTALKNVLDCDGDLNAMDFNECRAAVAMADPEYAQEDGNE